VGRNERKTVDFTYKVAAKPAQPATPTAKPAQPAAPAAKPAQKVTPAATPQTPVQGTYRIGDTGPAGGIVFYDKGKVSDGWRYLEAAPKDAGMAYWGPYFDISGTKTDIGSGKKNTELIVAAFKAKGETGTAPQLCEAFTNNGYKDWFLPSWDELDLMYKNLKSKGLGRFTNGLYWSSYQPDTYGAWGQMFSHGGLGYGFKELTFYVRAVRAF
jgi:hypothetical protein